MYLFVCSWNVLADCYLQEKLSSSQNFEESDKRFLSWNKRKENILKCINESNGDILFFQEIDHFHFYDFHLQDAGYQSIYLQRPQKMDGCLISFKTNLYELLHVQNIQLNDLYTINSTNSRHNLL